jgi:hypothetical protein
MKTAEWAKALRSGDYEQGQDYLCRDGKFCCLGVLCEIRGLPKEVIPGSAQPDNIYYGFEGLVSGGSRSVQQSVIPWAAQSTILEDLNLHQVVEDDVGDKRPLHTHLICMNDEGKTFNEIADYIEGVVAGNES